ncbi:MAG: hypothetical protein U0838_13035 [Chloroflexota bacterium]
MTARTARSALLEAVGLEGVEREIERVDRRLARERQRLVAGAARRTLVPAIRAEAPDQTDRRTTRLARGAVDARRTASGVSLRRAVSARNGRGGAVVVGPRGGKRGVWFRHITIGGARAHQVGGARAGWGGRGGRGRVFLYNPAGPFIALGPVRHPGLRGNPFVQRGYARASSSFLSAIAESTTAAEVK